MDRHTAVVQHGADDRRQRHEREFRSQQNDIDAATGRSRTRAVNGHD